MKHISPVFLFLVLFGFAVLTGCKEPDIEVASLGRWIPSPKLTGINPFLQDLPSQKYVVFSGTCDSRVDILSIRAFSSTTSLNDSWFSLPAHPDVEGTSLSSTAENDLDCKDGFFSFYLTKTEAHLNWGIDFGSAEVSIKRFEIKGTSVNLGDTRVLALLGNGWSSDPVGGTPLPYTLFIEKQSAPVGYTAAGQCTPFLVSVKNSAGELVTNSSATVTIQSFPSGTTSGGTAHTLYNSLSDCTSSTNGVSTRTFESGMSSFIAYIQVPGSTNTTVDFVPSSPIIASSEAESVTLKPSTARWYGPQTAGTSLDTTVDQGQCTAVTLKRFLYTGEADTASPAVAIPVSANNSKMKIYSNAACSSPTSTFNFDTNSAAATVYFRYEPTGNETGPQVIVSLGAVTNYDGPSSFKLTVDMSSYAAPQPTKLTLSTSNTNTIRGNCFDLSVSLKDNNNSLQPSDVARTFTVSSNGGQAFYTDSSCSSNATSFTIPAGQTNKTFYGKSLVGQTTYSFNVSVSSSGLTGASLAFSNSFSMTGFDIPNLENTNILTSCQSYNVYLVDTMGTIPVTATTLVSITANASTNFYDNYDDCDDGTGSWDYSGNVVSENIQPINPGPSGYYSLHLKSWATAPTSTGTLSINLFGFTKVFNVRVKN